MRLGQRPLASPMLVSDRGGVQSQSRVLAALATAEQKAMAALLGAAREWKAPENVPTLAYGAAEAAAYFAWLAEHLSIASAERRGRANTALDALASPSLLITLKRTDKEYASLVHAAGKDHADPRQTLARLAGAFSTAPRDQTEDNALENLWKKALSSDAKAFTDTDSTPRLEFDQLVRIVIDHCQRSYLGANPVEQAQWTSAPAHTNQFTRRALGAWRDALEAHQVRLARGAVSSVNVYPYVALETLPRNPDQLVLLAVTPFDPWFVDDRVPEDRRMPEILLAVYETPGDLRLGAKDLRELETTLAAHLGRFTYRLMSSRRGDALANSAGEGAEIARYWFGQGVSHFLRETDGGGLEFEDVVQFWRRFVEELLCAKIAGVHQTETFPFDRAYIIRGTPAVALTEATPTVTVIETAVQSRQADTNFQFLSSTERDRLGVDLEDLNLTEKIVKHALTLELRRDDQTDFIVARDKSGGSSITHTMSMADLLSRAAESEDTPSLHALSSLLAHAAAKPGVTSVAGRQLADFQRRVRSRFDREGLLYDFHAGVAMATEAPMLEAIDTAYRKIFAATLDPGGASGEQAATTGRDAKFVLFCFEPSLAEGNRRSNTHGGQEERGKSDYFLGAEHAITVILVADVDVEKGIQEITAEKGDLQVLIQMILQQRIRDRRREASTIDSRVNLIEGVLGSFVHKFVNLIATGDPATDQRRGAELHQLRRGLERIIRFDHESLIPVTTDSGTDSLAKLIWRGVEAKDAKGGDLKKELQAFVEEVVAKEAAARGEAIAPPTLDISFGSAPALSARLPLEAVKECIEVTLSNAVQAAVSPRAPRPARLHISAQAYALPNSADWVWDLAIENTTAPIPASVWRSLTSDEPAAQESANREKARSTGVGVYMARQLLRSAFGRRSDIRYFLLQETYLRASLQIPVQIIAPSVRAAEPAPAPAPAAPPAQILYIEDNDNLAARTQSWLRQKLTAIGVKHVATRSEAVEYARQAAALKLMISDLSIPEQPGGRVQQMHGPKALEAVLSHGATGPVWIFTGGDWKDANSVLVRHLGPDKFGYEIAAEEDGLSKLHIAGVVTILPGVKTIEDGPSSAPFEQALANIFDANAGSAPMQEAPTNDANAIATVSLKSSDADAWQDAAQATSGGVLIVDAEDASLAEALEAWTTHKGFPEIDRHQSSHSSPYPLWDSTVHRWIAMRMPKAAALPAPARYWCLCHNIAPTDLPAEGCASYWAALISEASGPLGLVRHEIANMRGAALAESALFQAVRQRVSALEDVIRPSSADEAQLEHTLSAGAAERLAERLDELQPQKAGDPARLFEQLEQALIDLLRRTEESAPGEVEALQRLMASVRAMDRLLRLSERAAP